MLNTTELGRSLVKMMDFDDPEFVGFESDYILSVKNWADVLSDYVQNIIPISITIKTASSAFISTMIGASEFGAAAIAMPVAFSAFATALAVGMGPTFIGVPPVIPFVPAPIFAMGFSGVPAAGVAIALTAAIDIWFRTGLAINPVTGVTTIWS